MRLRSCVLALLSLLPLAALATPTENCGLRVLPAPGQVVIDGVCTDWNLAGGIFCCEDVETARDTMSIWYHLMSDAENLYVLARFRDPTPMGNQGVVGADQAWRDDCLQIRTIVRYEQPDERVAHFTCWQGREQRQAIEIAYGRNFSAGSVKNAVNQGGAQALRADADGKGYTQEIRLPWRLLCPAGQTLKAGDSLRITFECRIEPGVGPKECFYPGVAVDRIFAFQAYRQFGPARLVAESAVVPQPLRLADGREFPVSTQNGRPVVDWTGLQGADTLPGFKPLAFTLPAAGYVSLHLKNAAGQVVRQLLGQRPFAKGEHSVNWDGLSDWEHRTPGQPLPAGDYTWESIWHPGIGLRLAGWASNGGSAPWDSVPAANWGGDHGPPIACATSGDTVLLGWHGAEAGKAIVATDLGGRVKWRMRYGWGSTLDIAVDGDTVYVLHAGHLVFRLDLAGGFHTFWKDSEATERFIKDLWEKPDTMPANASCLGAAAGKLYLGFATGPFAQDDVLDWPALIRELAAGKGPAAPAWQQLAPAAAKDLEAYAAGKLDAKRVQLRDLLTPLNKLLADPSLQPAGQTLAANALLVANRRQIETAYPGLFKSRRRDFVAALDRDAGKLLGTWDLPSPVALEAVSDERVYAVCEGSRVVALNPCTGAVKTLVEGLHNAVSLTVDATGDLYVGLREPANVVQVYSPAGKLLRSIGKPGGRPEIGRFDRDGMHHVAGLGVDRSGQLWVAEQDDTPKRISVWDSRSGAFAKEYFGTTHYGASGGAISPRDPCRMFGEGCEWQLDPKTGQAVCLYTVRSEQAGFARYAVGANGREYICLADADGPKQTATLLLYVRLADGSFKRCAKFSGGRNELAPRIWSDANGDEQEQPAELVPLPWSLRLIGNNAWSASLNQDLSITAGSNVDPKVSTRRGQQVVESLPGPGIQLLVKGFTPCGAPLYDVEGARQLPSLGASMASLDNRSVLTINPGGRDQPNRYECYEVATGKLLWTYPNPFSGVHGSHKAPGTAPGLIRGAFGMIGCARLPDPVGHVWAINTNVGEWHLLSESGYYLTRLWEGDRINFVWPAAAVPGAILDKVPPGAGGEDFGGSLVQEANGDVYVQAGKTALWNVKVVGLEGIRPLAGGKITLSAADTVQAAQLREQLLQQSSGRQQYEVARRSIAFTGNLRTDFKGLPLLSFQKQTDARVTAAAAWDQDCLYLAWEVADSTLWVNGADLPELLYARGDTVDFQLGSDPQADPKRREAGPGDLRLSIGNLKGTPTAVLYRFKATPQDHPKVFSSGLVAHYEVDSVKVLAAAQLKLRLDPRSQTCTVEAAIPLATLGLSQLAGSARRGDFGVTHGDGSGNDTALRTYWSNQQTGLVDDEVYELKIAPLNWGDLQFTP